MNKSKVLLFCTLLLVLNSLPSFGQYMIWSTMNGGPGRSIPVNYVKSQIMNISNQFKYFWYDSETPFISRADYRKTVSDHNIQLQSNQNRTQLTNQTINQNNIILSWMDNNNNFVYATRTEIASLRIDSYLITIINGNRVYFLDFHPMNNTGKSYGTQVSQNWLNQNLDNMLSGMVTQNSSINSNYYNIRSGYLTSSSPFDSRSLDRVARTFRFETLNQSWFSNVNLIRGKTENEIRGYLTQTGLTTSEQNAIFFEFRNSEGYGDVATAVRFNYKDRNNYLWFIHIERE